MIVGGETRGFIERDVERGEIRLGFTIGGKGRGDGSVSERAWGRQELA